MVPPPSARFSRGAKQLAVVGRWICYVPGQRLLDLGCSTGALLVLRAARFSLDIAGFNSYQINFNRNFYKDTSLRPLEEIETDLKRIEKEILVEVTE